MKTENKLEFGVLRELIATNFNQMKSEVIYLTDVNRDEIWQQYLSGFSEEDKQEHNCNCCKSFIRQFGAMVTLNSVGQLVSLWNTNNQDLGQYTNSVNNLKSYVESQKITDNLLSVSKKAGVDKSLANSGVVWRHFYLELPTALVAKEKDIPTLLNEKRTNKELLKRALDELTQDATETILDLAAQGTLYRGNEFVSLLTSFLTLQKEYETIRNEKTKDNYCWLKSTNSAMSRIRNTSIGTLLIDLSAGLDLDSAVRKFESVVAPTNYKRPTALVTPKMVEQAKATLTELGLLESLERRLANETDLSISDIIYSDKVSSLTRYFITIDDV